MDKQQHLDLANDYANEADELEASAINAAEVAIASIKAASLKKPSTCSRRLLKT